MAYTITCDGSTIYDLSNPDLILISPELKMADNSAGSLGFTIHSDHPCYCLIKRITSEITVFEDGVEIWSGRVMEEGKEIRKRKTFYCEGELAYLNDSSQEPAEYHDVTVRGFLEALINCHNAKVSADKQFRVGVVSVTDSNDSLYRYTNFEKTIEAINEKLIDRLGGHLRIRKINGVRYLDYLADYSPLINQQIRFGENLLDYAEHYDSREFATVLVPLGATLDNSTIEGLNARTTIASVNGGSIYLVNSEAVRTYGWIEKVVIWDDVTVPANLKRKAQTYLSELQFDDLELEICAVDLHNLDTNIQSIHLLDQVRAISEPHGMDRIFPVTELSIPLDHPGDYRFTLNSRIRKTLTQVNNETNREILEKIERIPSKQSFLEEAKRNASELIHAATHGYVVTTANEQLIMDTDDVETATRLWRWNLGGLGYSKDGYNGTFGTAITMDGGIVGDYLVAGSVKAEKLSIEYRSEVTQAISNAQAEAQNYTDQKLTDYYSTTQVDQKFKAAEGEFISEIEGVTRNVASTYETKLDAAGKLETAQRYTDSEITTTKSAIKQTTDSITASVQSLEKELKEVNYVIDPGFSKMSDYWTVNDEGVSSTTYDNKPCCAVNYYVVSASEVLIRNNNPIQLMTQANINVKCKCQSAGSDSLITPSTIVLGLYNYTGGYYTARKSIEAVFNSWSELDYTFENVPIGNYYLQIYVSVEGTADGVYITDVFAGLVTNTLKNQYYSAIKLTTDSIESTVKKGEFASYLTQYYDRVILAFNNQSQYTELAEGYIAFYDQTKTASKQRMKLDESGTHFYRDGYTLGYIGSTQWVTDSSHKGLAINLEPDGKFISFGYKASSQATEYTAIFAFSQANSLYTDYGLHLQVPTYTGDITVGNLAIKSKVSFTNGDTTYNGTFTVDGTQFRVRQGLIVSIS